MPSDNKPENSDSPSHGVEKAKDVSNQAAIAMELPFVLVSAVVVGGLLGYFLDHWLHTKPVFLLVLGGIGFYAGVRDVLRRLARSGDGIKRS
jgi:ATP synthase protein I